MSKIFYIVTILFVILLVGGVVISENMAKKTQPSQSIEQPKVTLEQLESVLIQEKVEDNLPKNSLDIPKDKWGEKMPVLSQRVLKFLYDQTVIEATPPKDKVEEYVLFLKAWGKPWRTYYLQTAFEKQELKLIWDELLLVQANTPEELEKQKAQVIEILKKVEPNPELPENTNLSEHFKIQADIGKAIKEGKLTEIQTMNIKLSDKSYAKSELTQVLSQSLDPKLGEYKDILEISSATRFLKLQSLLKEKLGYLASKISYHTKGQAVDLKLSSDAKKRFDEYLKTKVGNITRLDQVTSLNKKGISLTVSNLVKNGVLEKTSELAQVYNILEQSLKGTGVEIIDETFFGIRLSKEGQVTEINPTFHLQLPY